MLVLLFQALPPLAGPQDAGYRGVMPRRTLYMHPAAARALLALERDTGGLVYTDVYRSPEAIYAAYQVRPGTQPVGWSFHGFGGCVDVDVDATKRKLGVTYPELVAIMEAHGFHCHRRDGFAGENQSESWHFNYLGDDAPALLALTTEHHRTWSNPAEAMIQKWYGTKLQPDDAEVDILLRRAGMSDVRTFQRKWGLVTDGVVGPITRRVLAFVTASRIIPQPATG